MQSLNVFSVMQSIHVVGHNLSAMVFGPSSAPDVDFINRLPHELIAKILQIVINPPNDRREMGPEDAYTTPVVSASLPITPFPLSQVCRRWRYIAQATHGLWSSMAIGHPTKHLIHRVGLWLQYANGPLNIDFFQREPESLEDLEAATEIIDLLCSRYKQWCRVRFHLHQDVFPPSLASHLHLISTLCWPNLRSVVISNPYNFVSSEEAVTQAWRSLNKIPSLRTLKWLSSDLLYRPAECLLQSLTSLSLQGISARELLQGITACFNLRELEAELSDRDSIYGAELQRVQPVLHDRLEHISLTGKPREIQGFLHSLVLPKLVSVELSFADTTTCQYIWALIHRSKTYLRRLILQVSSVYDQTLADWLEFAYLQALETLAISGAEVGNHTFTKLTLFPAAHLNRRRYLPYLQNLSLSVCRADVDDTVFLGMLGSRLFTVEGEPYKAELMKAAFLVLNKTNQMRMYEEMCQSCITGTYKSYVDSKGWNDRNVVIQQQ